MNKLTILVDGGWHLMKNLQYFESGFSTELPIAVRQETSNEFKETLAKSLLKILKVFPVADNIILMSEGGSWRNTLPIPLQLQEQSITYKGSRFKQYNIDWDLIYKSYNEFAQNVAKAGITHSVARGIEGDDWAWYWSRKLNNDGINTIIWSTDCDLKQLVQTKNNAFTAWYNDKAGLVLPSNCTWRTDTGELFEILQSPPFQSYVLSEVTKKIKKQTYINPDQIIINKILCGDKGDNIKPVARYQKNGRNYGFANKDYENIISELNLDSMGDVLNKTNQICDYICHMKKFLPYNIQTEKVDEMIKYNIQLVWLNANVIPENIQKIMQDAADYKIPDINSIRSNYKTIMEPNKQIENIFNELNF